MKEPDMHLTSYAVLVSERKDKRLSIFVEVARESKVLKTVDRRSAFAIVDRLDPRLEGYLRELARAEHLRRRSTARRLKKPIVPSRQLTLL